MTVYKQVTSSATVLPNQSKLGPDTTGGIIVKPNGHGRCMIAEWMLVRLHALLHTSSPSPLMYAACVPPASRLYAAARMPHAPVAYVAACTVANMVATDAARTTCIACCPVGCIHCCTQLSRSSYGKELLQVGFIVGVLAAAILGIIIAVASVLLLGGLMVYGAGVRYYWVGRDRCRCSGSTSSSTTHTRCAASRRCC